MNSATNQSTTGVDELDPEIRAATAEEISEVIIPSWMQSYARSLPAKFLRADSRYGAGRERYWSAMRSRIERVLATGTTSVRVAIVARILAAWVCDDQRNRVLHYGYTRDNFRRQGLCRALAGWIEDPKGGNVVLAFCPPPWFSRPDLETGRVMWQGHQLIDLVTAY
ncbi:MAG TPA: hypothetical protein VGG39_23450 [Polyangiaceae bacterium]|jgi:hypothetical protein